MGTDAKLYEAIFTRKSVHEFAKEPLADAVVADVAAFLDQTDQIPGLEARFETASPEAVTDSSAPHYILAWCRPDAAGYVNLGYTLQAADLYIRSLGLGAHWKAMPRLKGRPAASPDGWRYSNLLAFGTPAEPMRAGEADFKRLPIQTVSNEDNPVARAARLAPSGLNDQPWTFEFAADAVRVRLTPRGLLSRVAGRADQISVGIALRHVVVALEHEGTPATGIEVGTSGKRPVAIVRLAR